tara:strand:- start:875 stop:1060 length:186 start_codon:yes stop_codon:yes gene_type:complete
MDKEMKELTKRINAILKSDKEGLEKFQDLEEESNAEYIYEGRIEALESVLEIITELEGEEK